MITVDLPEDVLVAAIRRLPATKRNRVINAIQDDPIDRPIRLVTVPASSLNKLAGLVSIGGDALVDSERLFFFRNCVLLFLSKQSPGFRTVLSDYTPKSLPLSNKTTESCIFMTH